MSKILLIGNGPSAVEKELGELIDSSEFDKVARFNRWKFDSDGSEYSQDFSKFVGTRCDYWIINDLHLTETKLGINKRELYEIVLVVMPNFKFRHNQELVNQVMNNYSNIKFINPNIEDNINKVINFQPSWPSTGVVAMEFAVQSFDEVYLHGFDTYNTKYDTLHYFEDENAHFGKNMFKHKKRSDHTPDKEVQYIKHIIQNYNVKFL